jgi:DNA processing protein
MVNKTAILAMLFLKDLGRQKAIKIIKESKSLETLNDLNRILKGNYSSESIESAWSKSQEIIDKCIESEIEIISMEDKLYPIELLKIRNPPVLLYYVGDTDLLNQKSIAIVGTRDASDKGREAAYELSTSLVDKGYVIVSGLAKGIDTEAHKGALSKDGATIAVIAQGIDTLSKNIVNQFVGSGGILSEFTLGIKSNKWHFVDRDRLQSGLSKATIVVETSLKGGTMHTAKFCKEQGRALFAISDIEAEGNKKLLREDAIPIGSDIGVLQIEDELKKFYTKGKVQSALGEFN